jgi:hypothetical protein
MRLFFDQNISKKTMIRVHQYVRTRNVEITISGAIYLASVVEYIIAEILVASLRLQSSPSSSGFKIKDHMIIHVIEEDEELFYIFAENAAFLRCTEQKHSTREEDVVSASNTTISADEETRPLRSSGPLIKQSAGTLADLPYSSKASTKENTIMSPLTADNSEMWKRGKSSKMDERLFNSIIYRLLKQINVSNDPPRDGGTDDRNISKKAVYVLNDLITAFILEVVGFAQPQQQQLQDGKTEETEKSGPSLSSTISRRPKESLTIRHITCIIDDMLVGDMRSYAINSARENLQLYSKLFHL